MPTSHSSNCSQGDDSMEVDAPAPQTHLSDTAQFTSTLSPSPSINIDLVAGRSPKFISSSAAGNHLSSARVALYQTRRLRKKRKSQDGLTEIRKQEQRASKKICNARTRRGNVYLDDNAITEVEIIVLEDNSDLGTVPYVNGAESVEEHIKPSPLSTNHDRIQAAKIAKLAKLEGTTEDIHTGLRKRDFVARRSRMAESFTAD